MKTGVFKISSQEDFDTAWELWNDFVFATINSFVPKVVQLYYTVVRDMGSALHTENLLM